MFKRTIVSVAVVVMSAALTQGAANAGTPVLIDFEKTWDFGNGDINEYYNGGSAADGSTGAPNFGVSFANLSGLSNDALGPYYANAPSSQGVAYSHDTAFMNVAVGADALSFYYSTAADVTGAIKAYSGLNGTGTLLGTVNLIANSQGSYDSWTQASLSFTGLAQSFDLSGASSTVAFDNITVAAVPEPSIYLSLLCGLGVVGFVAARRKQNNA